MDLHKKINKSFLKVPLLILSFCICFTFFNLNVFAEGLGDAGDGKPATEVSTSETTKDTPNTVIGEHEDGSWRGGGNNSYKAWYEVSKNQNGGDMVEFVAEDKYGNVYRGNEAVNRTKNYNIDTDSFYESMMALNNMTEDQTNAWLAENGFSVDADGRIKDKDGNTLSWVDLAAKDAKDWEEEIKDEEGNVTDKIKHHICGSVEVSLGTRWNLVSVNGFGGGSSSK